MLNKLYTCHLFKISTYLWKVIILTGFILALCFFTSGQSAPAVSENKELVDSLTKHIDDKALNDLFQKDNNLYFEIVKRRYEKALRKNDNLKIAENLIYIGRSNTMRGNFDQSEQNLLESLYYLSLSPNSKFESMVFLRLGDNYLFRQDYLKAIANYEHAIKISRKIQNKNARVDLVVKAKLQLGQLYSNMQMFEDARTIFSEALTELKNVDDPYLESVLEAYIGLSYLQEKRTEKAITHLLKGIKTMDPSNEGFIAELNGSLGEAYQLSKEYENARFTIQKAINYYQKTNLTETSAYYLNLLRLANLNFSQKIHLDSTILIGEKVLRESKESNSEPLIMYASDLLYKAYKEKGDNKLALQMKELSEFYSNKFDREGKVERARIAKIRGQLIREKQKLSRSTEEYSRSKENSRMWVIVFLSSAILLILVVFLYYFRRSRNYSEERKRLLAQLSQSDRSNAQIVNDNDILVGVIHSIDEDRINEYSGNKLNETDWKILHNLILEPNNTNREIADKVHMSYDGVVSSLRKMYKIFGIDVKDHHKLELLLKLTNISQVELNPKQ